MSYIAHIRGSDGVIQSVEEHLLGVQALAESYGEKLGVKHITGLAGLLHDMGKFTEEFKSYILHAVQHPDHPPKRGSVDHSTAGGRLLFRLLHQESKPSLEWVIAEIVGNAIISHHSYLHDFLNEDLTSDYLRRVSEKEIESYEEAEQGFYQYVMSQHDLMQYVGKAIAELDAFMRKPIKLSIECKLMFLTKFIFSALIDADRTDTRCFEERRQHPESMDAGVLFRSYYDKLMQHIDGLQQHPDAGSSVNMLRRSMSERCEQIALREPDIFTLSIPTGGGKTLASFRYALKHALEYDKKRIIYIVPFTTIIEQNAKEIRHITGDESNLLEHHSNVIDDAWDDDEHIDGMMNTSQKLMLAKDNWDAPIIFTTMVQFLNVIYARGSRNIRRMHNLTQSVIIFDEVQKVPTHCVSLFNQAVNFLKLYGQSTVVLCTATQPSLDVVKHRIDLTPGAEMIEHLDDTIEAFKRVEIVDHATDYRMETEQLAAFIEEKLQHVDSILIILNTKSVVRKLYESLSLGDETAVYHLSTSMCAAHRNDRLSRIRNHLDRQEKVVCMSTQLIEAGVDVSFQCVIRSLAGLDSIAQAAGRCNRHGKDFIRQVYVIDHAEENLKHLREMEKGKRIARQILIDVKQNSALFGGNILSVGAMKKYFEAYYADLSTELDYHVPKLQKDMMELLMAGRKSSGYYQSYCFAHKKSLSQFIINSYRTAADHFEVIKSYTTSVIVPYGEGKDIIAELSGNETIESFSDLLKSAQQYSVNLFSYELKQLEQSNGLVSLWEGKLWALQDSAYNKDFGVDVHNDSGFELGYF